MYGVRANGDGINALILPDGCSWRQRVALVCGVEQTKVMPSNA